MSMTKEEYFAKKQSLIRALDEEFAKSNNTVEVGDTIEDDIGKGIVDKIRIEDSYAGQLPQMFYICYELNKSGEISDTKRRRGIWQRNLKK